MKKIDLTYLACPYRHVDILIKKKRCAAAHYTAAKLSSQGYHVFSPLTHNDILADIAQNIPGQHWMELDLAILAMCKKLVILKLDGWQSSRGIQIEITFAKEKGIPIEEMDPPEESAYIHLVGSSAIGSRQTLLS